MESPMIALLLVSACNPARIAFNDVSDTALDADSGADSAADTALDTGTDTAVDSVDSADSAADTALDTGDTGTDTAVDSADSAADTALDTGTDTAVDSADSAADTALDTSTVPSAPTVVALATTEGSTDLTLAVELADVDGDLDGGVLTVDVDGVTTSYALAGGVESWDGATATVRLAFTPCQHGETWTITVAATDATGLTSADSTAPVTLSGTSYTYSESGDTYPDALDLGVVSPGTFICGDIDRAVGHKFYMGSDLDWLAFTPDADGRWTISLTWDDTSADEDLELMDAMTTEIQAANDHTGAQPEEVSYVLAAGTDYYAWVGGWTLPATSYVVEFE